MMKQLRLEREASKEGVACTAVQDGDVVGSSAARELFFRGRGFVKDCFCTVAGDGVAEGAEGEFGAVEYPVLFGDSEGC